MSRGAITAEVIDEVLPAINFAEPVLNRAAESRERQVRDRTTAGEAQQIFDLGAV